MALLGASFQIGRSALAAYQSAIAITGQNIANVGNPNYTRLTGRLTTLQGGPTLGGVAPGGGVNLTALERHVDEALESRLRMSLGTRAARCRRSPGSNGFVAPDPRSERPSGPTQSSALGAHDR